MIDCRTCDHGIDLSPEAVVCQAPWAKQSVRDQAGDFPEAGLVIRVPFSCSQYRRGSGQGCGCDRGILHKCERHQTTIATVVTHGHTPKD